MSSAGLPRLPSVPNETTFSSAIVEASGLISCKVPTYLEWISANDSIGWDGSDRDVPNITLGDQVEALTARS